MRWSSRFVAIEFAIFEPICSADAPR